MQHGLSESLKRSAADLERAKRTNALVCLVLGALFAGFGVASGVGGVAAAFGDAGPGALAGIAAFALFWFALAVLLLVIGVRGLAKHRKKHRLMSAGLRGSARVVRHEATRLRVDGAEVYSFDLEVTLPSHAPYAVQMKEPVQRRGAVYDGAELTVFADPAQPRELVIDWWG